jgi:dynein heavy chain
LKPYLLFESKLVFEPLLVCVSQVPVGAPGRQFMTTLWIHEILRVFYDRLTEHADNQWMLNLLKGLLPTHFEVEFNTVLKHLGNGEAGEVKDLEVDDMRRLFFGNYLDPEKGGEEQPPREYELIEDIPKLIGVMEDYLVDHNGMSKRPMNLAMFLFAVEHVSRICRILTQPGGHLLLVGVGGSGRQSLTRLSAFMYGMEVIQVEISKSYTMVEWREDLRRILRQSGAEGKPTVFLFSDTQIKDEAFVEDINNVLNAGEFPGCCLYLA